MSFACRRVFRILARGDSINFARAKRAIFFISPRMVRQVECQLVVMLCKLEPGYAGIAQKFKFIFLISNQGFGGGEIWHGCGPGYN